MSRILAVGAGRQLNHNAVPNGGRLLPGPPVFSFANRVATIGAGGIRH